MKLAMLCVVVQEALVFRGWYVGVFPALIYREIEGVPAFPALVDQRQGISGVLCRAQVRSYHYRLCRLYLL